MKNLEAFSARLKSSRESYVKSIKIESVGNLPNTESLGLSVTIEDIPQPSRNAEITERPRTPPIQQVDEHEWLRCMDDFATYIHNIDLDASGPGGPLNGKTNKPRPITVALIDDGFDINDQSVYEKVLGGRSFCVKNNLNAPYWATSRSHGTVMASLICRVCPKARLYILRLDEHIARDQKRRQITAKSAELVCP